MLRSLFAGISGLRVNQTMLDVTGNNIANANTIGYKGATTVFQDTLSQMMIGGTASNAERGGTNPIQVGLGVQMATTATNFGQGSAQMTGRCPGASFPRLAWLPGYELLINERGVATLLEADLGEIWGVIWSVTTADIEALDRFEGTHEGRYARVEIVVETAEGPESVWAYRDHRIAPGLARPGYLERVVSGALEHGLPQTYIDRLPAILAVAV